MQSLKLVVVLLFLLGVSLPALAADKVVVETASSMVKNSNKAREASEFFKPGALIVSTPHRGKHLTKTDKKVADLYDAGAFIVQAQGLAAGDSVDNDFEDYDTETAANTVYDPFEGWNRFWFKFNDKFFTYIAKPVYHGWEYVTPKQVRTGLKNFFHNALFPVRFVNNLFQFKFKGAGVEFSRFMLNTMMSAGFLDLASKKKTIVPMDSIGEDFGQTLGVWGIGHGPYLVWPFVGPSSVRETFGRIGDLFAAPFVYLQPWYLSTATGLTLRFNDLDEVLPLYDDLVGAAVDPYISMREAYINFRNTHVKQ